jgi:hypothetical protein
MKVYLLACLLQKYVNDKKASRVNIKACCAEYKRPRACAAGNIAIDASAESEIPSYKACDAFIEVAAASQKTQHLPTCSCVTNC